MSRMLFAPLALGLAVVGSPAQAQVSAGIHIVDGPIAAHILVGEPQYRRPVTVYPRRRVVVVERYAPRVLLVERIHRGEGYWRHRGFNRISAYYDRERDVYYDRYDRHYPGLREVVLYERGGRYYCDDRDQDRTWNRHDRWDDDD